MIYYDQAIATADRELSVRRARNRAFIISEIVTFLLAVLSIVLFTTGTGDGLMMALAVLFIALYIYIRFTDTRNDKVIRQFEDIRSACIRERNYLNGKYDDFDDGRRYADANHPFTTDLDIFGRESLYQRVCRAVTTGGADALAEAFKLTDGPHDERHDAIAELAKKPELLIEFKRWGQRGVANTTAVRKAFNNIQTLKLPSWARINVVKVISWIYLAVFICALLYSIATQTNLLSMVWWCIINFFAVYIICNKSMKAITDAVGGLVKQHGVYVQLVAIVEQTETQETVLANLRNQVAGASESLKTLDGILQRLESRGNILGLFIFDMLFLWDYQILNSFNRWQKRYASHFDQWIAAVSQFDMLVSMATFRYNESDLTTDAEIIDSDKVEYEAKGLFHPFLGKKAVRNDFTITDRNFYIITGANMAGKSTFLRSLGINYVLAMNGMPVFASKLTVSRFHLFTSMRTTDDLTRGISYFNAELLRLQQILDSLRDDSPTLIILDEILKGTNSEDKLSGSRMFLEYVAKKNVTGVIATHDLKLSSMVEAYAERFHNYCFEIALGTDVTYSYKITPGVARNQNATFLLKKMLEK